MTAPAAFSIISFTSPDDLPEPDNGPYLVATKHGYFVHRNFRFGRVLVPTTDAPLTPEARPTLWHDIDPIPHQLIGQAYSFFRSIYSKRKSEAMVDITWSEERGYRLFVPPQTATGGGVNAKRNPEHYVGQIVGTIHSHCNFNAFHSGTDTHDADGHDGLHITIGDVMKPEPSIAIMISVAKARWPFTLDEITDGPLQIVPHPEWWERYVSDPAPTVHKGSTRKPNSTTSNGTISRLTPQSPVVVAKATSTSAYDSYSLDTLLWRFDGIYSEEEQEQILDADHAIDQIRDALETLGIQMDTAFTPAFANVLDDDDPTPRLPFLE